MCLEAGGPRSFCCQLGGRFVTNGGSSDQRMLTLINTQHFLLYSASRQLLLRRYGEKPSRVLVVFIPVT